jgi:hypothetical protein
MVTFEILFIRLLIYTFNSGFFTLHLTDIKNEKLSIVGVLNNLKTWRTLDMLKMLYITFPVHNYKAIVCMLIIQRHVHTIDTPVN